VGGGGGGGGGVGGGGGGLGWRRSEKGHSSLFDRGFDSFRSKFNASTSSTPNSTGVGLSKRLAAKGAQVVRGRNSVP